MKTLSTNQGIKSSNGGVIDNGNTSGNPQVSTSGPVNYAENDGTNRYQFGAGSGNEGPGRGNAKRLNSDDQMPNQTNN